MIKNEQHNNQPKGKTMIIALNYAHAISNPFLPINQETNKPFEMRTVQGEISGTFDGSEWNVFVSVNGEDFPAGYSADRDWETKD